MRSGARDARAERSRRPPSVMRRYAKRAPAAISMPQRSIDLQSLRGLAMEESQGRSHSRRSFLQKAGAGLAAATAGGVLDAARGAYAKAPAQVTRATTTL